MKEKELILKLTNGDVGAFKIIYQKYGFKVQYICRSFHFSKEDTEEILQEVFLKLWKFRAQLDPDQSLNAYLQKVARNQVLNQIRKRSNGEKAKNEWTQSPFADSLLDQIVSKDLENQARLLIEQLPDQKRKIFLMAKSQGIPVSEIAEEMNLSIRTVENQLYRAVKLLREKLKQLQTEVQVLILLGLFF